MKLHPNLKSFQTMTPVHKDVTERLFGIDPELYHRVRMVLEINLSERHLRGGNATKRKYEHDRRLKEQKMIR